MPQHPSPEDLGEPSLKVAGLQIWIHGREFPEATDADDGNWLRVTVYCGASGASVYVAGPILQIGDILRWGQQAAQLLEKKADKAALDPLEPELSVLIDSLDSMGHLRLRVEITPDHLQQKHAFEFEIDQSYLPGLIKQCEQAGREYPVRSA